MNPTSTQLSKMHLAGYHCKQCQIENVVAGDTVPTNCASCNSTELEKKWEHIETTQKTVEKIL